MLGNDDRCEMRSTVCVCEAIEDTPAVNTDRRHRMPASRRKDGTMERVTTSIRPASADDTAALGQVHVRAWQAAYGGVMPDGYLDGLDATERSAMWARFFERAPSDPQLDIVTDMTTTSRH